MECPITDERKARGAEVQDDDLQVVQVVVPAAHEHPPSAGQTVPRRSNAVDVQADPGQEPAGSIVPAAVLGDAVDEQDRGPGRAGRGPVADVQGRAVGRVHTIVSAGRLRRPNRVSTMLGSSAPAVDAATQPPDGGLPLASVNFSGSPASFIYPVRKHAPRRGRPAK